MKTTWAAMAMGAMFMMTAVLPSTSASHCQTGLEIFSRHSLTPVIRPQTSTAPGVCIDTADPLNTHTLDPTSNQIFARLKAPLSEQWPSVYIELHGLGWNHTYFTAIRTAGVVGVTYDLREWVTMPGGADATGELVATLRHPLQSDMRVVYHKEPLPTAPSPAVPPATNVGTPDDPLV